MSSRAVRAQLTASATGVTRFGLRRDAINSARLNLPAVDEQGRIANLLDREVGKLDVLVRAKRRLRELLEHRWNALVRAAVTSHHHVPDPGGNTGLPTYRRLKHLARLVSGGTPRTEESSYWSAAGEGGIAWITIGDMTRSDPIQRTERAVTTKGVAAARLTVAPAGTILFSMYASLGKVAQTAIPASWNQAILAVFPDDELADPRFLKYALTALQPTIAEEARSNTQDNLNAEQVGNLSVVCPEIEQQRYVAGFLDQRWQRHRTLKSRLDRQIELLDERRETLITAAVTGHLDPTSYRASALAT
jgi:restriction endonuclease S subunit